MEEWLSPFYKTTQDFKRWSQVTVMSKTISPLVGVGRHSAPDLGFHYGDSLVLLISPALTLDHYHYPSYFNSPYYFSFWASCPQTLVCPLLCSSSTPPPGSSRGWLFHTAECSAWVWSLRALPAQPSSSSAPTASLSLNSFLLFRTYNCLNDWFTSCWYPAPTWMSFLWDSHRQYTRSQQSLWNKVWSQISLLVPEWTSKNKWTRHIDYNHCL